jgi:hypothetical protein
MHQWPVKEIKWVAGSLGQESPTRSAWLLSVMQLVIENQERRTERRELDDDSGFAEPPSPSALS